LGCKCIFLLGGKTRDEVPTAMFLRSGDIVLMAGEARECFHGNLMNDNHNAETPYRLGFVSALTFSFLSQVYHGSSQKMTSKICLLLFHNFLVKMSGSYWAIFRIPE
jgi:hypothetical protein